MKGIWNIWSFVINFHYFVQKKNFETLFLSFSAKKLITFVINIYISSFTILEVIKLFSVNADFFQINCQQCEKF